MSLLLWLPALLLDAFGCGLLRRPAVALPLLTGLASLQALLRVRVRDEGAGGADESRGTGLLGVRRRVAALDGTTVVTSPERGPTEMDMELPCAW